MVDMCVNMGIKPRVHYQQGYTCADIADLFEHQVSAFGQKLSEDAPVHCQLPTHLEGSGSDFIE